MGLGKAGSRIPVTPRNPHLALPCHNTGTMTNMVRTTSTRREQRTNTPTAPTPRERSSLVEVHHHTAWSPLFVAALFAGLLAFLLIAQSRTEAFERGHHGWVSAHTLAMVGHLGAHTGFVGYAVRSRSPDGSPRYEYFQRSPSPFDTGLKLFLDAVADAPGERIHVARQAVNVLFVVTMFLAYVILRRLGTDAPIALASVLFAFSGYFVAFYRDLVSVDLPAILGLFILLCGLSTYRRTGKASFLYGAALVAASLGAGFSSLPALGLWALFETWERAARERGRGPLPAWSTVWHPGTRALLLAVSIVAMFIAYNTAMEVRVRGVSIAETSLVDGAVRRLGLGATAPSDAGRPLSWALHAQTMLERSTISFLPYPFGVTEELKGALQWYVGRLGIPVLALIFVGFAALVWRQHAHLQQRDRPIYLVLALSGLAWLGPMKNLSVPHNYTAIYLIGWTLAVFTAIFNLLPRRLHVGIVMGALAVFLGASFSAQQTHTERSREATLYTDDLERVAARLAPGINVHVVGKFDDEVDGTPDLIPGVPYALPFYLPDAYLAPLELSEYALSRHRDLALDGFTTELLTPGSSRVFLFRLRRLPDGTGRRADSLGPVTG